MMLFEKEELLKRVPDRMVSKDELEYIMEGMPYYNTMKPSLFMSRRKLGRLLDIEHRNNDRLVMKLCEMQEKLDLLEGRLKNEN